MILPPDFKELLEELARAKVEFLLIGGYAVAFHGRPRATKDIDILLQGDGENLARAARALTTFGAPPSVTASIASMQPTDVIYLGQPPMRVDFLRTIDGVEPDKLFASAILTEIDGIRFKVIALDDLIRNKRVSARPQDLIDADFLEKIQSRSMHKH